MVGQGSPNRWSERSCVALRRGRWLIRLLLLLLFALFAAADATFAEEINVRLRLAWGSGDGAKHRWFGTITCQEARFTDLQPLGIENDAPAAILLNGSDLIIDPWERRGFDGCDITVVGQSESVVRFELRSEQATGPTVVEVPLFKLAKEQVREPLDSLGSFLLAYRCPGDRFRVLPTRENLIFGPGEIWQLRLQTDFHTEAAQEPVVVDAALRAIGKESILWQSSQVITSDSSARDQLALDLTCPSVEGAYRLSLTARSEASFPTRLVPGQNVKPFATREIDFVVIDPAAKLAPLTDNWTPVLSIDPANPSWWQRLPAWAQVSRLTGKPPGSLGNVRLLPYTGQPQGLVELAPSASKQDSSWQSFSLPIQEVGAPHLVEISYPLDVRQHLGVSIVEPDAAGRVVASIVDSGLLVEDIVEPDSARPGTHRVLFWPRTQSPQLLIVNHGAQTPAVFGQITLSRHHDAASQGIAAPTSRSTRLVAAYIAKPVFAQNMGAAEVLDPASGMSVQSWSTFLDGARRLTQYVKLSGYNSAFISVMADGSAIYPSRLLAPSPRYDTGQIAASGQDPQRKDILEMLLRVCDREGISVVPTLQLCCPLPRLEALSNSGADEAAGTTWVDSLGRQFSEAKPEAKLPAQYNLLNDRVQQEVSAVVLELIDRYGEHPAMAGIALQLDSNGFGVLPGLAWGFDDQTIAAFSAETGIELSAQGDKRFLDRAQLLLGDHRQAWQTWRIKRVNEFYRKLADQVRARRDSLKLLLTTESLFAEAGLQQSVRSSVSNPGHVRDFLAERGIDLEQLAGIPGVEITNTCRDTHNEHLQEHVTDIVLNDFAQEGQLLPSKKGSVNLMFHTFEQSRLPSFDQASPFGAERTHLVLAHHAKLPTSTSPTLAALLEDQATTSIVEGGEYLSMSLDPSHGKALYGWAQLPSDAMDVRMLKQQPVIVRVSRNANETYIACANQSPWSTTAELEIEAPQTASWQEVEPVGLAADLAAALPAKVPAGKSSLVLQLPPHGLRVWKLDTPKVRAGELKVSANPAARDFLSRKIEELESRTGNLNIERDFPQLQNPGFELEEGTTRIFGWQPRKGMAGSVEVATSDAHSGTHALRLKSTDPVGVAVQSHLFPLATTGMLIVKSHVRVAQSEDSAQLIVALETEDPNLYRRAKAIPLAAGSQQWTEAEFVVNDLPVGDAEQVRLLFLVTGPADVAIDDIQLCDLRFDDQRRTELVKRVFAAKTALDENQYVDCLRLLNEYWPRYLVEYVPPLERATPALAKQPDTSPTKEEDGKSKGRLRGWMPRLFR